MNFINFNKKYVIYNRNNIINLHQIISTKKAMIKMKKIVIFVLLASMVISCGPSKTVKESKKVIKGEWLLNTITFSEYGTFKVIFFNDVSKNCLEGSIWKFIPNNNSGKYTITNEDCSQGERNFIFTIKEVNSETGLYDFLLKPTNEKHKSEDNKGYKIHLAQLTENAMVWEQMASIDGKNIKINMNFIKTN